jgi:hypothetical protein
MVTPDRALFGFCGIWGQGSAVFLPLGLAQEHNGPCLPTERGAGESRLRLPIERAQSAVPPPIGRQQRRRATNRTQKWRLAEVCFP